MTNTQEITLRTGMDELSEKERELREAGYNFYQVGDRFTWKQNDDDFSVLCSTRQQAASFFYRQMQKQS